MRLGLLAFVPLVLALVAVPGGGAAVRFDSTTCSVDFRARNANLDCGLAIPGGTLTLGGSPAIATEVRGGERAAFSYDAVGRLTAADVAGDRTSYAYDDSGRLIAAVAPAGDIRYAYDSLGRLVAAGGASFVYGDLGLVRVAAPDGSTVDYTYGSGGLLASASAGTRTARFAYDTHGRVVRAEVDGSTTEYQYQDGLPVLRVADGQTTQYTYDGRRRLVRSSTAGGEAVSYSYDTDGSLLAAVSSDGVTRLTYDRGGRLIAIADPAGATTALAYDSSGFLSLVAPAIGQGVVVDFEEGAPDQPMIVGAVYTDTAGRWFSINLRGRVSACTTCP